MNTLLTYALAFFAAASPIAAQLTPSQVLILIGPPGSGKTVQSARLSKAYKIPAISMESLLKQELGKKTKLAKVLASPVASGELVNDEAANELVQARIMKPDASRGFILDGYPTTPAQAKALDAFLTEHQFSAPVVVIIQADDTVLKQRMSARGRADDAPENIDRRLHEYRELGAFTEKWYGAESTVRVDGAGSVDGVATAITQAIESVRARKGLKQRQP